MFKYTCICAASSKKIVLSCFVDTTHRYNIHIYIYIYCCQHLVEWGLCHFFDKLDTWTWQLNESIRDELARERRRHNEVRQLWQANLVLKNDKFVLPIVLSIQLNLYCDLNTLHPGTIYNTVVSTCKYYLGDHLFLFDNI